MDYRKRKIEIVRKLMDSGIVDLVNSLVKSKIRYGNFSLESKKEKEIANNLRLTLEDLGPVFVKFGQLLSSRRDVFSKNFIAEMEKLQDDVLPLDFSEIKETLEEEFKKPVDEVYSYFDEKPLASGSIAQTHYAKIKLEGQEKEVCVKVLRNGIEDLIETDTKIMLDLAEKYGKRFEFSSNFDLVSTLEEFRKSLFREMNFELEKKNLKKFYGLNKKEKYVKSPLAYDSFSTKKVLTMQFISGKSIREIFSYPKNIRNEISKKLIASFVNQCFSYGFFQADPHPGNIFVNEKGEIYLLDFGIVGSLSENNRFQIMKIFVGVSFNQVKFISDAVINMGLIKKNFDQIDDFERRIQEILDKYLVVSLHEMRISNLIEDFFAILGDFEIKIPTELTLFGKTIFTLEGLIQGLSKDESFVELAYPIAKSMLIKLFKPKSLLDKVIPNLYDTLILMRDLPKSSLSILRQASSGTFSIVEKKSKEELDLLEKNEKRKSLSTIILSLSIIFAAIIVAMAILNLNFLPQKSIMVALLIGLILSMLVLLYKFFKI